MKTVETILVIFIIVFGTVSCTDELFTSDNELLKGGKNLKMATGSLEIIWKGGGKNSKMGSSSDTELGNQPENRRAFFEFNAHEVAAPGMPKGEVTFFVTDQDSIVHREIRAQVFDVHFIPDKPTKGWFVAEVIYDSKGCAGGTGPGGHDTGCIDESHTDGGGCADDTSHDSGCSHDTTDGTDTGEGGCTDDHTTDEGGCSGSDMGGGEEHPGSTGSTDKGNPLSGKNCRLGQLIIVKVHDMATPGMDPDGEGDLKGDALSWKWYAPDHEYDINIEPKLCKKTIIAGNLVVHF